MARPARKWSEDDIETFRRLAETDGLSPQELGKHFGVTDASIRSAARKKGIRLGKSRNAPMPAADHPFRVYSFIQLGPKHG